ncbi:MAG: peptide chain release factor N(5)-glutamine methyltransferase [Bacteroidota bacterium]
MKSSKSSFNYFVSKINSIYDINEAKSIAFLFFESVFNFTKMDILLDKPLPEVFDFELVIERLLKYEPIQYIIGEADFFGRKFRVNHYTLIPRQETEELVSLVIEKLKSVPHLIAKRHVLDIGTGSGCIAISLDQSVENLTVKAWDISEEALKIAKQNNAINQANVIFEKQDILKEPLSSDQKFDLIVSNPPYVTNADKVLMQKNVLDFEPELALFVEDANPIIFYEKIGQFAIQNLKPNGSLLVEINEKFGQEIANYFKVLGFAKIEIIKDIHQKDRIVTAQKL